MPKYFEIKFYKDWIENSIRRLSFLCCLTDIKIGWINPYKHTIFHSPFWLLWNVSITSNVFWSCPYLLWVKETTEPPLAQRGHRTQGLTHLLDQQGKHVWLIVRQSYPWKLADEMQSARIFLPDRNIIYNQFFKTLGQTYKVVCFLSTGGVK